MWNTGYADLMIVIGIDVFKHGRKKLDIFGRPDLPEL